MKRSRTGRNGKQERMSYRCSTAEITDETECLKYINEKCVFQAVRGALQYQMKLAFPQVNHSQLYSLSEPHIIPNMVWIFTEN